MNKFDFTYWNNKYKNNTTGWDLGQISTPIKTYFDQIENKDISILIPGGGNGYEAEYLHNLGFKKVHLLDIVKQPLQNFNLRVPEFPKNHLIQTDFFKLSGKYDLILEQTFFCALDPSIRTRYVEKVNELLTENGKLVGLLFDFPLAEEGPPFGGSIDEYMSIFYPFFKIKILERSYNSIPDRNGKELFVKFEKK